jgi:SOS-response transcriptional repressor LexA
VSLSLTSRQVEILRVIDSLSRAQGYAPTGAEIGENLQPPVSQQAVYCALTILRLKAVVKWTGGVYRSLHLTDEGRKALG